MGKSVAGASDPAFRANDIAEIIKRDGWASTTRTEIFCAREAQNQKGIFDLAKA
jgi:hypothetical protein